MHVTKCNILRAVVKTVERELQVQHEMWGQNMCIDEIIVFLLFLYYGRENNTIHILAYCCNSVVTLLQIVEK